MYHKLILVGNLGRDPEMRYIPSGQAVTSFSVATSEKWTGSDGQQQELTVWWRVTAWGKMAQNCNQYLKKGSKVLVEGRMNADENGGPKVWSGQDGVAKASYEVTAGTIKFLSGKAQSGDQEAQAEQGNQDQDEIPF